MTASWSVSIRESPQESAETVLIHPGILAEVAATAGLGVNAFENVLSISASFPR
jgi:hypothetical protein